MEPQPESKEGDRLPRHPSPELLKAYLQSHDAQCPVCGYNLRGVVLAVCPECEAPIELMVGSQQARLGPWLMAMLAFAMALGFDGVIGLLLVVPVIISGGEAKEALFLAGTLVTLGLVCVGMLWVLVARKRSWMGLDVRQQWAIARVIFISVFLVHLAVGVGFVLIAI